MNTSDQIGDLLRDLAPQVLGLYDVLTTVAPGPMVTLSRAVALANVRGPKAGLALLGNLNTDDRIAHTHRLEAARAHLLEPPPPDRMTGQVASRRSRPNRHLPR